MAEHSYCKQQMPGARRFVLRMLAALVQLSYAANTCAESAAMESGPADPAREHGQVDDEDEDSLRERLLEREDKRRAPDPLRITLGERPLVLSGEYELELVPRDHFRLGGDAVTRDRLQLEHGVELEAFYGFGESLSLFAQFRVARKLPLRARVDGDRAASSIERGEMWLYAGDVGGSGFDLDLGRLDYEDERRWWWDEELDSVRVSWPREDVDIALALGREVAADRLDESMIDPEQDRVWRLIAEASWDYAQGHGLEFFLLRQLDRSDSPAAGQLVRTPRIDESDAALTWVGTRGLGVFDLGERGLLGYWLDLARVRGNERVIEFDETSDQFSVVEDVLERRVVGWAVDAGVTYFPNLPREPRVFVGYASGSRDRNPDDTTDRAFRQTGLQANEAGFGGVERYANYGFALDPELSNLSVATLGAGVSILRGSSLDLVFHRYRLRQPAEALRNAAIALELSGDRRDLGWGIDLVLALEEWRRWELTLVASGFRADAALGVDRGRWNHAGLLALRFAF